MSLTHSIVALNASTSTILTLPNTQEPDYSHDITISVQNLDTSITVYLGSSSVTSSNYGFALAPNAVFSMDLLPTDDLYAIAASGTPNVALIKVIH